MENPCNIFNSLVKEGKITEEIKMIDDKKINTIIFDVNRNEYQKICQDLNFGCSVNPLAILIFLGDEYSFKEKYSLLSDTKIADDFCICNDYECTELYIFAKNINDTQTEILFNIPRHGDAIRHISFINNIDKSVLQMDMSDFEIYIENKNNDIHEYIGTYNTVNNKIVFNKYLNLNLNNKNTNAEFNLIIRVNTIDLKYWSEIKISPGYVIFNQDIFKK